MQTRIALLFALAVLLLVGGGIVLAQHDGQHAEETGMASGGDYRLSSQSWRVSGTASGTGYRLLGPAVPNLQGSGCCCIFLPCVFGDYVPYP